MYITNRDEEWFNMAEEDYMEDPLETEHIEQAIYELPNKRYALTDEELYLVCGIVAAEAQNEPYDGKMAVAQTILNNCERNNRRPADIAWMYADPRHTWSDEVWQAVSAVFFEGHTVTDELIMWFYNPALCVSEWHESQRFVMEIGGHRFFSEVER
jgi:N-acetylmuramoyl-L-alanine amidase